jgi:hypothetical protein
MNRNDRDGLHKRRGYWHYTRLIDGKPRSFSTFAAAACERNKGDRDSVGRAAASY